MLASSLEPPMSSDDFSLTFPHTKQNLHQKYVCISQFKVLVIEKRQHFVQIHIPQKFPSSGPHKFWQVQYFKVCYQLKISKLIQIGPFYTK